MALRAAELDITLPALPHAPGRVRRAVLEFAAGRVADVYAVGLAVSEVVNNVVVHAYRDRPADLGPGDVRVRACLGDRDLVIAVHDNGTGVRARHDSPGAGLGLGLAGAVAERVEIKSAGHETRVVLRFARTPDA